MNPAIIILGGGPAGSALALELARAGCRVTILERAVSVGWKVGETLPPEAQIELARLGLTERFARQLHLPCHGIVSLWGSAAPVERDSLFNPYGHGWQLDRAAFETDLLAAAQEAGAVVQLGVVVNEIRRASSGTPGKEPGWFVESTAGVAYCDWLVDCTGRHAILARREGGQYEQLDHLVAIVGLCRAARDSDEDTRTYVESHADGWCYSALRPDRTRIVAFQTDADLLPAATVTTDWLESRLIDSEIGRLLARHDYDFIGQPLLVPAHAGRYARASGDNWLAVGDAAMTFDPLSGQGTNKSLVSARQAVQSILYGQDYQQGCNALWDSFLQQRARIYAQEKRWSANLFWSRRHAPLLPNRPSTLLMTTT
jgi:flavin-dependent dehydrogenase